MKHLKAFENKKAKFKVGNYVVAEYCIFYPHNEEDAKFKKYLQTTTGKIIARDCDGDKTWYYVNYNNNEGFSKSQSFIEAELRFATPKETEECKIRQNMEKYNL